MHAAWAKRTPRLLAMAFVPALALAGCGQPSTATSSVLQGSQPEMRGDLGTLTYRAVDRLVAAVPELQVGQPVAVGSIVDVQRVDRSLPLGNLIADLARSRQVQRGVPVSEMRLRSEVRFDHKQGELLFSNDPRAVVPAPSVAAVLTGTYAAGDEMIFVSLKLVAVSDARIVGAVDFEVPRHGTETLLMPST